MGASVTMSELEGRPKSGPVQALSKLGSKDRGQQNLCMKYKYSIVYSSYYYIYYYIIQVK